MVSRLLAQPAHYSLYIHVPFCARKCDYCHFYVVPDKEMFHAPFMRALRRHWELRCSQLPTPCSIYFGGGTPSRLGPHAIGEILSWIQPGPEVEVTLEANPDHLKRHDLEGYRRVGINRLSLGVQSFDDSMLRTLSRTHSAADASHIVQMAHDCGFTNISIDLMYDLPHQTLEIWEHTLTHACTLPITHLSLYNLTIEPHTAFYKRRHTLPQPNADDSLHMLELAESYLTSHGLDRYEISAFAKENSASRHNLGYWTDRPFLGLGPSAFSDWEKRRFQNIPHFWRYVRALCEEGVEPISFEEKLPPTEREQERIAVGLRVFAGVVTHGAEVWLLPLIKEGWLEPVPNSQRLRLTAQGRLFYDTVCEKIFSLIVI